MDAIVYKGQKVITTELLAQVYETSPKNIQANYARNERYFEHGIHFFLLIGEELKDFKNQPTTSGLVGKTASSLYLWTERGANRHCKILDTDMAWRQFDHLVDVYFRVKSAVNALPSTPPAVSPGGLARLISVTRTAMLDMGCTANEVGQMVQSMLKTWAVPVPDALAKQIPGQMSLFSPSRPMLDS